jgi:hypothetical protein
MIFAFVAPPSNPTRDRGEDVWITDNRIYLGDGYPGSAIVCAAPRGGPEVRCVDNVLYAPGLGGKGEATLGGGWSSSGNRIDGPNPFAKAPNQLTGFFAFLTVPPGPPFPEHLHLKKMCGIAGASGPACLAGAARAPSSTSTAARRRQRRARARARRGRGLDASLPAAARSQRRLRGARRGISSLGCVMFVDGDCSRARLVRRGLNFLPASRCRRDGRPPSRTPSSERAEPLRGHGMRRPVRRMPAAATR